MNIYNFLAWFIIIWAVWTMMCCVSDKKKNISIEWKSNLIGSFLVSLVFNSLGFLVVWLFKMGAT